MPALRAILIGGTILLAGCATVAPPQASKNMIPDVIVAPVNATSVVEELALSVESESPADVWAVIRAGLALADESDRPAVANAIRTLHAGAPILPALEPRASRYLAYVVDEVRQRHLPMELALLPIVESTLNPYAFSSSGAAGLWQLIPSTAKRHGVEIDWWYDGRRDLLDSTAAALDYLAYLYDEFDDWLLAIAAYNSGEGRVRRALRKMPNAGFFDLPLPRETKNYVPQVLALAHLIAQYDRVQLPPLGIDPPFFVTTIDRQIDLETLAQHGSFSLDELLEFNPGLNHCATPPDRSYRMLIPANLRSDVEYAIDQYPTDSPQWRNHRVKAGESLSVIAKHYNTSVATIHSANGMSGSLIRPGQLLVIPLVQMQSGALAANPKVHARQQWHRYKIRPGDSLWSISRKFNTSIATLVHANRLNAAAALRIGRVLAVPGADASKAIIYTVRKGDSLSRIANRFNVSVAEISAWNKIDPSAILRPGVRLVVHRRGGRDWT